MFHLITQNNQPYGSRRKCCEICGMSRESMNLNYTDSPVSYALHEDACNKEQKPKGAFPLYAEGTVTPSDPFTATIARNMTEGELNRYSDCSASIRAEIVKRYEWASSEWYEEYIEENERAQALTKELTEIRYERNKLKQKLDEIKAVCAS